MNEEHWGPEKWSDVSLDTQIVSWISKQAQCFFHNPGAPPLVFVQKEKPVIPDQPPLLPPLDWRVRITKGKTRILRAVSWLYNMTGATLGNSPRGITRRLARGLACEMHCPKNESTPLKQHENGKSILGAPRDVGLCARAPGIWISRKLGLCSEAVYNWNSGDKTDNELIQNKEMWSSSFFHQISGCSLACVLSPLPSLECYNNSMNINCILLQHS